MLQQLLFLHLRSSYLVRFRSGQSIPNPSVYEINGLIQCVISIYIVVYLEVSTSIYTYSYCKHLFGSQTSLYIKILSNKILYFQYGDISITRSSVYRSMLLFVVVFLKYNNWLYSTLQYVFALSKSCFKLLTWKYI